jgi:hypothetical protein
VSSFKDIVGRQSRLLEKLLEQSNQQPSEPLQ